MNSNYIQGATNQIYTATSAAPYKVYVTDSFNCVGISAVTTVTKSCREESVLSEDQNSFFTIYPNPTTGNLHIRWNDAGSNAVISVMDMSGKILWQENIETGNNESELQLPADFSNGMYLLLLEDEDHFLKKLFEVQR